MSSTPDADVAGAFPFRRILFIHQNFPGQFVHLAPALARLGCEVKALSITGRPVEGVDVRRYEVRAKATFEAKHPFSDFEGKALRAGTCAGAMKRLAGEGFQPDLIVAHPGWGESLYCKDVWPDAVLVAYGEFYYRVQGGDYAFDPEFSSDTLEGRMRLRLKNTMLLHAYAAADAILCPTPWQKSCLPAELQHKAMVIFDGIDTRQVAPNPASVVKLNRAGLVLGRNDRVLTFLNRNLEPHRGFHVFMRALPEILARQPDAHCVIVGEDSVSYGSPPREFPNWRQAMLKEVGDRLPAGRVHFVGRVGYQDYLRLLQVSTCHVYLTYPFVLSWSCVEALAAGCRVVASDTSPVRDVITHGRNGLLFDFFNRNGLVDQTSKILANPRDYDQMATEASNRARRDYDLQSICLPRQLRWLASLPTRNTIFV
ncbi:MAG TPA: glycosyltransferase [Ramlibacter sp.]|jgi:glycosyltransferase involved in cell wall biosynthesis|nr:glycosyltransferase [Ramlibacter sp.]